MKSRCAPSAPVLFGLLFSGLLLYGAICSAQDEAAHVRAPLPSAEEIAKLPPDGGPKYNRLIFEKSPYLLQHAANPVHWYPWGEEAFEAARDQNKPVFLSIGYSTCHWCHVMEAESFENEEVGALMNEHYISIKVDREERPDIDNIYMSVTQAMTGSGGWPMTIIMTPDKEPFFAGTYFPKESRSGRPGMLELLPGIAQAWTTRRADINRQIDQVVAHLREISRTASGSALQPAVLTEAFSQFERRFDPRQGGFGTAPKFPTPHNHSFLLRYGRRTGNEKALEMVETTLTKMRQGGIFDHVGFGFHRYSTDPDWLLPHFEKMLYDQAMLTIVYTELFQATGNDEYARTVREIIAYVLRDMTSPEGGFYSAEDADSEGEEGKFYVWTTDEVVSILGESDGKFFAEAFNFTPGGNFKDQSTGRKTGSNIPHLTEPIEALAKKFDSTPERLRRRIEACRRKLFEVREKRIHPIKDDKVLTDWNGLMIVALAKAGQALEEPKFTDAARKAADFIHGELRNKDGRLLHRYRQGEAGLLAHLEDYAYYTWGLIDLYEATFDTQYLSRAIELQKITVEKFWDEKSGGFYFTAHDGEVLLARMKDIYDGARPSGNSVAALNLLRLGRITTNADWETKAEAVMKAFSKEVRRSPSAYAQLMVALEFLTGPSYEVVIAGKMGAADTRAMVSALRKEFVPNKIVLLRPDGEEDPAISKIAEFTRSQRTVDGAATAYVCLNYACKAPVTDPDAMMASLAP